MALQAPAMKRFTTACRRGNRLHRQFSGPTTHQIATVNNIIRYGRPKLSYTITHKNLSSQCGWPIVILHGMFGSKNNWKSIGKSLGHKTGREVITFDARNHGNSEQHISMSYDAMCFDTERLLKELGIKKCSLIGHSMGGKTAMCFALQYPQMVKNLIIVDSAPQLSIAASSAVTCLAAMMKLNIQNINSYMEANEVLQSDIKDDAIRQFLLTNLRVSNGTARWILNLQIFHKNMEQLLGFPQFSTEQFNGPTLFIAGRDSDYITDKEIPKILRLFSDAQIEYIENAGHWVHSDQPAAFVNSVCQFLQNCD